MIPLNLDKIQLKKTAPVAADSLLSSDQFDVEEDIDDDDDDAEEQFGQVRNERRLFPDLTHARPCWSSKW